MQDVARASPCGKQPNWRSLLRILAATGLFGAVHSALASHAAKNAATALFGSRNRNGLYRAFYIVQSFVTFAALVQYILRQPDRVLYKATGPLAGALRLSQAACLGAAVWAAYDVGLSRISGWASFRAWRRGGEVPAEPEAQGPSADDDGSLGVRGPFRWSRHPLNFWPVPIFFLNPKMTVNLLTFAVAATAYLAAGSAHEEARLRSVYGETYTDYQRSRVPFYLPFRRLRFWPAT